MARFSLSSRAFLVWVISVAVGSGVLVASCVRLASRMDAKDTIRISLASCKTTIPAPGSAQYTFPFTTSPSCSVSSHAEEMVYFEYREIDDDEEEEVSPAAMVPTEQFQLTKSCFSVSVC